MTKTIFLVPRSKVRCYTLTDDVRRMLLSSDWVRVPAAQMRMPSRAAIRKRRSRMRQNGEL